MPSNSDSIVITGNGTWNSSGYTMFTFEGTDDGGRDNGCLTILNGTFNHSGADAMVMVANSSTSKPHILINGGTFTATNISSAFGIFYCHQTPAPIITINGGVFVRNGRTNEFFHFFPAEGGAMYLNGGTFYDVNSDADFVDVTLSASEGGKAGFKLTRNSSTYPTSAKLMKNIPFDVPDWILTNL